MRRTVTSLRLRSRRTRCGTRSGWGTRAVDFDGDLPPLVSLYDRLNATLNGPFRRDTAYWRRWIVNGKLKENDRHAVRVVTLDDRILGYFITAGTDRICEMVWDLESEEALGSVLGGIARSVAADRLDFSFFHQEVFDYLSRHSRPLSLDEIRKKDYFLSKSVRYAGLFKLISNHSSVLRDVGNTAALNRLLRRNNYVFWDLDHF